MVRPYKDHKKKVGGTVSYGSNELSCLYKKCKVLACIYCTVSSVLELEFSSPIQVQLFREMELMNHMLGRSAGASGESGRIAQTPSLNKVPAHRAEDVVPWEYYSKAIFSQYNNNPKRAMEGSLSGALDDAVMQVIVLPFHKNFFYALCLFLLPMNANAFGFRF